MVLQTYIMLLLYLHLYLSKGENIVLIIADDLDLVLDGMVRILFVININDIVLHFIDYI